MDIGQCTFLYITLRRLTVEQLQWKLIKAVELNSSQLERDLEWSFLEGTIVKTLRCEPGVGSHQDSETLQEH